LDQNADPGGLRWLGALHPSALVPHLLPVGGLLALFNRFSLFHLRFNPKECVERNLCRSRYPMGVNVDQKFNVSDCIRCLECSTCGALEPCFAVPKDSSKRALSK
jgi:polyferredoxin